MILRKKKSEITGIQRPPNLEACYLSQAYFSFFSPMTSMMDKALSTLVSDFWLSTANGSF